MGVVLYQILNKTSWEALRGLPGNDERQSESILSEALRDQDAIDRLLSFQLNKTYEEIVMRMCRLNPTERTGSVIEVLRLVGQKSATVLNAAATTLEKKVGYLESQVISRLDNVETLESQVISRLDTVENKVDDVGNKVVHGTDAVMAQLEALNLRIDQGFTSLGESFVSLQESLTLEENLSLSDRLGDVATRRHEEIKQLIRDMEG